MNNWFEEKVSQIDTEELKAFGIKLWTRYGSAREMWEMLQFAQGVAEAQSERFVREVFYDSKADLCSFTLDSSVEKDGPVDLALLAVAKNTVSQFEWHGVVHHGKPMSD